ncbi:hypothetical protein C8J57DRAFT_1561956 [Mycena rebaudengoi]|nr:hypothetical protein C8J57DRAFT_1561956 [Mycena rebaudengoi]
MERRDSMVSALRDAKNELNGDELGVSHRRNAHGFLNGKHKVNAACRADGLLACERGCDAREGRGAGGERAGKGLEEPWHYGEGNGNDAQTASGPCLIYLMACRFERSARRHGPVSCESWKPDSGQDVLRSYIGGRSGRSAAACGSGCRAGKAGAVPPIIHQLIGYIFGFRNYFRNPQGAAPFRGSESGSKVGINSAGSWVHVGCWNINKWERRSAVMEWNGGGV